MRIRVRMAAVVICLSVVFLALFVDGARPRTWGAPGPRRWDMQSGIGARCEYDEDCAGLEHTFCRYQETCQCKKGFMASESGDRCVATVGAKCSTRFDCTGLGSADSADCRQGICDCTNSFVPHPSGNVCLKSAEHFEERCEESIQCDNLGDGATCLNGRCTCPTNQHEEDNHCYPNKGLGAACSDHECYIGDEYRGKVLCRDGTCKCREHFTQTLDGKCTAGAGGSSSLSVTLTLACEIVILLWMRK